MATNTVNEFDLNEIRDNLTAALIANPKEREELLISASSHSCRILGGAICDAVRAIDAVLYKTKIPHEMKEELHSLVHQELIEQLTRGEFRSL